MAERMLGKVVAGAALGGSALLVFTPGIAFADGHHDHEDGIRFKPHVVRAGEEVTLLESCEEPQEHAFVWSTVTGRVDLQPGEDPASPPNGQGGGAADSGKDQDRKEWRGDEHGQDGEGSGHGKGHERPGREGDKGHDRYGRENGKSGEDGRGKEPGMYQGDQSGSDKGAKPGREGGEEKSDEQGTNKGGWEHKRDHVYAGEATVAEDTKPGRYELRGSCGEGELIVLPTGGVDGGDGGDGGAGAGVDRNLAASGAGLIGAASLGGILLLRRRPIDESLV